MLSGGGGYIEEVSEVHFVKNSDSVTWMQKGINMNTPCKPVTDSLFEEGWVIALKFSFLHVP